jgi:hypothetical protein
MRISVTFVARKQSLIDMATLFGSDEMATLREMNRTIGFRTILLAVAFFASFLGRAAATEADYTGCYELVDAKAGRAFSLEVRQTTHARADVSFSAAMDDGSGSAPEGQGKGRIEDGVLSFAFKDSFKNEGTCTLASGKGGYHLNMTVLKVVDPSPFHFYGNVLLKKTASGPH